MHTLHYLFRLGRSIVRRTDRAEAVPKRRAPIGLLATGLALVALGIMADRDGLEASSATRGEVGELRQRVAFVYRHLGDLAQEGEREVAPVERILRDHTKDAGLARRIAVALVREGHQTGVDPRLLLAVLMTENPKLDTAARSFVGAVGLMQVMPFHAGEWGPCAQRLDDVDSNICHGARIFAHYLGTTNGDVDRALLRYNGCVNGTNTPDCDRYPTRVFARAGRASLWSWTRPAAAASR